jgi:hypothetical protein
MSGRGDASYFSPGVIVTIIIATGHFSDPTLVQYGVMAGSVSFLQTSSCSRYATRLSTLRQSRFVADRIVLTHSTLIGKDFECRAESKPRRPLTFTF